MSNAAQSIQSIPIDPLTGAVSIPIYQAFTFVQDAHGAAFAAVVTKPLSII